MWYVLHVFLVADLFSTRCSKKLSICEIVTIVICWIRSIVTISHGPCEKLRLRQTLIVFFGVRPSGSGWICAIRVTHIFPKDSQVFFELWIYECIIWQTRCVCVVLCIFFPRLFLIQLSLASQTKHCFKFGDSMWPFWGYNLLPHRKIPDVPQKGCHGQNFIFPQSSGWFSLSFQDRYFHKCRESSGAKKKTEMQKCHPNSICSGCFQPFLGGRTPGLPMVAPGFLAWQAKRLAVIWADGLGKAEPCRGSSCRGRSTGAIWTWDFWAPCACDWWDWLVFLFL